MSSCLFLLALVSLLTNDVLAFQRTFSVKDYLAKTEQFFETEWKELDEIKRMQRVKLHKEMCSLTTSEKGKRPKNAMDPCDNLDFFWDKFCEGQGCHMPKNPERVGSNEDKLGCQCSFSVAQEMKEGKRSKSGQNRQMPGFTSVGKKLKGLRMPESITEYMNMARGGKKNEFAFFEDEWKSLDLMSKIQRLENHEQFCRQRESLVPCVMKFQFWSRYCAENKCHIPKKPAKAMMDSNEIVITELDLTPRGTPRCSC